MSENDGSKKRKVHKHQRRKFTEEEDKKLLSLVNELGTKCWELISKQMPGRCGRQCRDRYSNYLQNGIIKKEWTPEEDALLIKYYHMLGPHWVEIAKLLEGRSGNNVKNRWHKYLSKNDIIPPPRQSSPDPETASSTKSKSQVLQILDRKLIDMIKTMDTNKQIDLFPSKCNSGGKIIPMNFTEF